MDWASVINRQHGALMRIIAALFAIAGLAEGGAVATLPRHLYRAVLNVLRPAESAVRRLIVIAARGLVLAARAGRGAPLGLILHAGTARTPAFLLIDPLKRFAFDAPARHAGPMPRISVPGLFDPVFIMEQVPTADDPINAERLCQRLFALKRALEDLQGQARRLSCWRSRRDLSRESGVLIRPGRLSPFRPGRPPGHRKRQVHEIDEVLLDCHYFALEACKKVNSS